jgi:hypothetical protein
LYCDEIITEEDYIVIESFEEKPKFYWNLFDLNIFPAEEVALEQLFIIDE